MYETRLGPERARGMNALGSLKRAGAVLVGGDDSPVCPLSPLDGMRAAAAHHVRDERLGIADALLMYTYDALVSGMPNERRAARARLRGRYRAA